MSKVNLKFKIQMGLIIALALFALTLIVSQNANPNAPALFAVKRLQEKAFLKLTPSPSGKVDYMSRLLDNRLKELQSIVKDKHYDYLLYSSLRYSTLAGQITDVIADNNLTDKVNVVKQQFSDHQKVLNELYILYPKNTSNLEYKYIEDDYNYLNLYLEKLPKTS
ncbi:hypothetical protein HYS95_02020 [Candidatus Daviesbacteria bacterium]|nr:hypothetical protein [Candidatus Daviesbacteria bacterium]